MKNRCSSREKALSFGVLAAGVAVVLTMGPAPVAAATDDRDLIDLEAALQGEYTDARGHDMEPLATERDSAESIVTAKDSAGGPVEIVVQYKPDLPSEDLSVAEAPVAGYTTEDPGPASGQIAAQPISDDVEWKPEAVIAVGTNTASFRWENVDFSVKVDGQVRGVSDDHNFTLEGLEAGREYFVDLVSAESADGKVRTRTVRVQTFGDTAGDTAERLVAPLTYQPYYQSYVHKTFIADNRVPAAQCNFGDASYTFGGDNRTFQFPSLSTPWDEPNYRTMMFLNVNWGNPAPYDIVWVKDVGATTVYKNGGLVNTLYADMSNMNVNNAYSTASFARAMINHSGSIPACQLWDFNYGGAISYNEVVEFYRSGTIEVMGSRRKAPHHEMYGAFTTSGGDGPLWRILGQRNNAGFGCLLAFNTCGTDDYDLSVSY